MGDIFHLKTSFLSFFYFVHKEYCQDQNSQKALPEGKKEEFLKKMEKK